MSRLRPGTPSSRFLILLWVGGLLLLIVVVWGIGRTTRSLFGSGAEPLPVEEPARSPSAAAPSPPTPTPTAAQMPQTGTPAAGTAEPPLSDLAPAVEWEAVQANEGIFQICRRHCPARWPPDDEGLVTYAQEVARLNGLVWPDPPLSQDQQLQMPPCP